jgi:hypothetical protein
VGDASADHGALTTSLLPSGDRSEALLAEMLVEAKRLAHSALPHQLKTHAVHQAQSLAPGGKQRFHASAVLRLGDPLDPQDRRHVLVEGAQRNNPKAMPDERTGLQQNVVAGQQNRRAGLLLQHETPHEHRVDARGVEAADSVPRPAHQGVAEEVEGGVVEHRQAGGLPLRVQ